MYTESESEALKGEVSPLQVRLLFHLAHKADDENKLMTYHSRLQDTVSDQLCLASIHHLRCHYQEATDIYKKLLLENRKFLALNIYIALCYYKLDFFDVSLEVLNVYLQQYPTSLVAINLKACNQYRVFNGKAAETELRALDQAVSEPIDNPLIQHNRVVFSGGEGALKVLPSLIGVIPEARLNLVIYHMKNEEYKEAYALMQDVEPTTPPDYILKGVVNAAIGQQTDSASHLKEAQQYFNLVGASASECDTIPGRQCMASCYFLAKQFDDVLIYLKSIESFFSNDDSFLFNIGVAKTSTGSFKEAVAHLLAVKSDKIRADPVYVSHLARCYIMTGKSREALALHAKVEANTQESFNLLVLIANDCYKMGAFLVALKAFDTLSRIDPNPEYFDGKIGSAVGVFQAFLAEKENADSLEQVVGILRNSPNNPQIEYVLRIIKKYA